jgi:hypothetical protein
MQTAEQKRRRHLAQQGAPFREAPDWMRVSRERLPPCVQAKTRDEMIDALAEHAAICIALIAELAT